MISKPLSCSSAWLRPSSTCTGRGSQMVSERGIAHIWVHGLIQHQPADSRRVMLSAISTLAPLVKPAIIPSIAIHCGVCTVYTIVVDARPSQSPVRSGLPAVAVANTGTSAWLSILVRRGAQPMQHVMMGEKPCTLPKTVTRRS